MMSHKALIYMALVILIVQVAVSSAGGPNDPCANCKCPAGSPKAVSAACRNCKCHGPKPVLRAQAPAKNSPAAGTPPARTTSGKAGTARAAAPARTRGNVKA